MSPRAWNVVQTFWTSDRLAPTSAPVIEVFPMFPVQTISVQVSYFSASIYVRHA